MSASQRRDVLELINPAWSTLSQEAVSQSLGVRSEKRQQAIGFYGNGLGTRRVPLISLQGLGYLQFWQGHGYS